MAKSAKYTEIENGQSSLFRFYFFYSKKKFVLLFYIKKLVCFCLLELNNDFNCFLTSLQELLFRLKI